MPPTREKFATQVNSEILSAVRSLADKEGRQFRRSWTRLSPILSRSARRPRPARM